MIKHVRNVGIAMLIGAAVGCGDYVVPRVNPSAADQAAAKEVVTALTGVYATYIDRQRPVRVVAGSWEQVAKADQEWSRRLSAGLRRAAEGAEPASSDSVWLLSFLDSAIGEVPRVSAMVVDREDSHCCIVVAVDVWLDGNDWKIGNAYHYGFVHAVSLEMLAKEIEEEERLYLAQAEMKR